jgi:putative PIN family toxin of toxin-antitoxin system
MIPVVLDTNVFVAGLRSADGASRLVLRHALQGRLQPLFGNALWLEYQELLSRPVWGTQTTPEERSTVLAALAHQGRWVRIYYGWRPNLPDEGDNHLIELAIAGHAEAIVTHNVRDRRLGELRLGHLRICTPAECLEVFV